MRSESAMDCRVALIGCGYWGSKHVRVFRELPGIRVSMVADPVQSRRAHIEQTYPDVRTTASYGDVLHSDAHGVVIATPVSTHFAIARDALLAGKDVLVEKPLTANAAEALELCRLADQLGRVLMVGHTFLYHPAVEYLKGLVESAALGRIYYADAARLNLGLFQRDTDVIWDLAPHDFSIFLHWLGKPSFIRAVGRDAIVAGMLDVAFIDLGFPSGCLIHVELSWLAPSKLRRTTIVGSEKMLIYEDTSTEPVRVFDSGVTMRTPRTFGEYQLAYRTGDVVAPRIEPREPLLVELADFCSAISTGITPRSSAQLGLEVVRTIEAAERSIEQGGCKVPVDGAEQTDGRNSP